MDDLNRHDIDVKKPRMLMTGATGFVGSHILPLLKRQYAVTTLGRSECNDIHADLSTDVPEIDCRHEIVLHMCGKAHTVPRTPAEQKMFYDVNLGGTKNLCSALERYGVPRVMVFLSTVAVYGCDSGNEIDESHGLDGTTAYARSKILAEEYLGTWCAKHGVRLAILRSPLIVGAGAPGNLGAMEDGIRRRRFALIDGGKALKSVLEVEKLAEIVPRVSTIGGTFNVCNARHSSFGELAHEVAMRHGYCRVPNIPMSVARIMARIGDLAEMLTGRNMPFDSARLKKMTSDLTFSNAKARRAGLL